MSNRNLITVREAASISGYTENYVRRLLTEGKIDGRKWVSTWMIEKASLLDWLANQRRVATMETCNN
jgi:hypothetical protein